MDTHTHKHAHPIPPLLGVQRSDRDQQRCREVLSVFTVLPGGGGDIRGGQQHQGSHRGVSASGQSADR